MMGWFFEKTPRHVLGWEPSPPMEIDPRILAEHDEFCDRIKAAKTCEEIDEVIEQHFSNLEAISPHAQDDLVAYSRWVRTRPIELPPPGLHFFDNFIRALALVFLGTTAMFVFFGLVSYAGSFFR